ADHPETARRDVRGKTDWPPDRCIKISQRQPAAEAVRDVMPDVAKVHINGVSKTYPGDKQAVQALQTVDLSIKPGEFVSIVGPSGCGKSTLLYIVGGFLPADGAVL